MTFSKGDAAAPAAVGSLLSSGKVGIFPSDTIYGIFGRVPETEERIKRIKGRGEDKHLLILLAEVEEVLRMSDTRIDPRLLSLWPGPLTLIVSRRGGGTVGVRVPGDGFVRSVLLSAGVPLYSTSVNRSGEPPLWRISEIMDEFADVVDFIVDGGDIPHGVSSTIVDVTSKPYRILRQGACAVPECLGEG